MAEAAKKERVVQEVKMEDGRTVEFVGKRRVNKETILDETKIQLDGDLLVLQPGAVSIRMDFVNGATRLIPLPLNLLPRFAGHGGEQKFGDELASPSDKPLSDDDMVVAIDDLNERIQRGEWKAAREAGDSFSGASIILRALHEVANTGKEPSDPGYKTMAQIKESIQKRLDAAKANDEGLTRARLYASFKNPETRVGKVVQRMEREALQKTTGVVDADKELDGLLAA